MTVIIFAHANLLLKFHRPPWCTKLILSIQVQERYKLFVLIAGVSGRFAVCIRLPTVN